MIYFYFSVLCVKSEDIDILCGASSVGKYIKCRTL